MKQPDIENRSRRWLEWILAGMVLPLAAFAVELPAEEIIRAEREALERASPMVMEVRRVNDLTAAQLVSEAGCVMVYGAVNYERCLHLGQAVPGAQEVEIIILPEADSLPADTLQFVHWSDPGDRVVGAIS